MCNALFLSVSPFLGISGWSPQNSDYKFCLLGYKNRGVISLGLSSERSARLKHVTVERAVIKSHGFVVFCFRAEVVLFPAKAEAAKCWLLFL